jgi:hypothetical protein
VLFSRNQLKDVLVLANFDLTLKMFYGFPYTGTWYNLMDNTSIVVTDNAPISIPPEFRIYGNKIASLAIANFEKQAEIYLYRSATITLNTNSTRFKFFYHCRTM